MRTKRFVIFWILLVVTTLSIGVVAFLFLRQEGETIQDRAEAARDHAEEARDLREEALKSAEEARKVVTGYREMVKYAQQMTDYADEQADYAMALRARTIADNIHLLMAELKDGLMQSLESIPAKNIGNELTRWKDENNFVGEVFLWSNDGSPQSIKQTANAKAEVEDIYLFKRDGSWVWEIYDKKQLASSSRSNNPKEVQQDAFDQLPEQTNVQLKPNTQVTQDIISLKDDSKGKPQFFPSIQVDQDDNENDLAQSDFQQANSTEQKLSAQLEQQQKEVADQLQALPKNKTWSDSDYLADNYQSSQEARRQLRSTVQNDVLTNLQKQRAPVALQNELPKVEPTGGWEYRNGSQGRSWGCWSRSSPVSTRGLQVDGSQLKKNLRAAFPEHVDEDEYFVLLDEKGIEVCSVGEMALEGDTVSRVELEVGKSLPGWTVLATRRALPSFALPVANLPEVDSTVEESDVSSVDDDDTSLAVAGEGWSGYIVTSSVMAAILIGSTLLGGSVLLLQVRRNSLEAVRKTTFVSNVSHELKTPLTTIRMYGEMLDDDLVKDEKKRRNYLSTIITESQRLTRLVNNVLDFSRLERGEKNYNMGKVDLAECLQEVLEAQRPRLVEKGFDVEWIAHEENCRIEADRDALEQVLLNLLDNVVKYASDGKWVEVKAESNKDEVAFEVSDHGPGIQTEQRERIFETFHRVDDSLTASQPGCGLGLGISRKLIEGMGGSITCKSNKPRGVRFRVAFPKVKEA